MSLLFWLISYSKDGNVEHSVLYTIGNAIEPFTQIFGMRWQLFISYLGGVFSKEASLGVMSVVFASTNDAFSLVSRNAAGANLGEMMRAVVSILFLPQCSISLVYLRWVQRIVKRIPLSGCLRLRVITLRFRLVWRLSFTTLRCGCSRTSSKTQTTIEAGMACRTVRHTCFMQKVNLV